MSNNPEDTRRQLLNLLDKTQRETIELLSSLDPNRVIHTDARAWRVRDILGHLGAWNMEAARALQAYAAGGEYCCIFSEMEYDDYNGAAADERKSWTMEQVCAEYVSSHDKLRQIVALLPDEKWHSDMLYPWNLEGSVAHFIKVMMDHEAVTHCGLIAKTTICG